MSDFKVGDIVYCLLAASCFTYGGVKPNHLILIEFIICGNDINTFYYVNYAKPEKHMECERRAKPWVVSDDMLFKTKQDCIDAFKKRLDEL